MLPRPRDSVDGRQKPRESTVAARLAYRRVGPAGEFHPAWGQDIRERQDDGTAPNVYVGQSSLDRLYETLTRHANCGAAGRASGVSPSVTVGTISTGITGTQ